MATNPASAMSAMPWGQAIGAIAQVASAPPVAPGTAESAGSVGNSFDSSGWNVTFGANSSIDSMRSQTAPTVAASGGTSGSGGGLLGGIGLGGIDQQTLLLLVGAVLLVKFMKKKGA